MWLFILKSPSTAPIPTASFQLRNDRVFLIMIAKNDQQLVTSCLRLSRQASTLLKLLLNAGLLGRGLMLLTITDVSVSPLEAIFSDTTGRITGNVFISYSHTSWPRPNNPAMSNDFNRVDYLITSDYLYLYLSTLKLIIFIMSLS